MPNKVEKSPDGSWIADGELGEHFTGAPEKIIPTILDAQQETKRTLQQTRQEKEQLEQQLAQLQQQYQQQQNPQQSVQNDPVAGYTPEQLLQLGNIYEESRARVRGFPNRQALWEYEQRQAGKLESFENSEAATQFYGRHPEFPGDEKSINMVQQVFDQIAQEIGAPIPVTPSTLEAAHLIAVQRKMYEPLPPEVIAQGQQQQNANRPGPPPMLHTGNPEQQLNQADPYSMKLDELRKMAIQQQLGGNK